MKATDFCFEFLFGAMRLPLVFAIKNFASSSRASPDHTDQKPHHAHFAEQLRLEICAVRSRRSLRLLSSSTSISSLGSWVRTADQMRDLRASPAFAKYKCETTRCEVDPSRLLVACWNVDLAKQLS
jgi:hypothetical protein